jgi:serine protease Do
MPIYELPKFESSKLKAPIELFKFWQNRIFIIFLVILFSFVFGGIGGLITGSYFFAEVKNQLAKLNIEIPTPTITEKETASEKEQVFVPQTSQEEKIIKAVNEVSGAVVSIIITADVEQYYFTPFEDVPLQKRTEKQEVGGGSGFIVSEEGMILTNKHVVLRDDVDYTVLTNDGQTFPAQVLARDPVQDLAVIKVDSGKPFPTVKLGDSDILQIGQTVIAIGNVLGEFQNSVSVGVISGLGRTITASGGGLIETLEDVIQTDAAINQGNSGGPLLNLKGEVIGINTATVVGGENIGFALPINKAKKGIEQVKTLGKIVYSFLGVRYVLINETIQKENNLAVDYGAWIMKGEAGEPAIFPGSAAEKAGLKEGDIILELNGEKITNENTLAKIIVKYNPGDKVILKILRDGQEKNIEVVLEERSE